MELTVKCRRREPGTKANALRRSGSIPAVVYGHNGAASTALTLDAVDAEGLVKHAVLNNTLIQLQIPEISGVGKVLLREVQTHPAKGFLYHLSFFSVAAQDSLKIEVPLHFVGEAPGVKAGGALDTQLNELTVQCAPDNIPDALNVDISQLQIGDTLYMRELEVPPGVMPMLSEDQAIATVLAPRTMAVETTTPTPDATAVTVGGESPIDPPEEITTAAP